MIVLEAALLGVVQGITEFLPISSSGHLILARAWFGWDTEQFGVAFDVACHVGTLVAVLAYFRRDLAAMAAALPRPASDAPPAVLLRRLAVGTTPIVALGLLAGDVLERGVRTPEIVAATLAIGAVGLLVAERVGTRTRGEATVGILEALAIGAAQAAALVPGVSRSGATMTVGLFVGLRREAAARFAFLLGVPAILAAAAGQSLDLAGHAVSAETLQLFAVGMIVSALVGYFTIKYFVRYVAAHSLDVFAVYRLALAAAAVGWLILR